MNELLQKHLLQLTSSTTKRLFHGQQDDPLGTILSHWYRQYQQLHGDGGKEMLILALSMALRLEDPHLVSNQPFHACETTNTESVFDWMKIENTVAVSVAKETTTRICKDLSMVAQKIIQGMVEREGMSRWYAERIANIAMELWSQQMDLCQQPMDPQRLDPRNQQQQMDPQRLDQQQQMDPQRLDQQQQMDPQRLDSLHSDWKQRIQIVTKHSIDEPVIALRCGLVIHAATMGREIGSSSLPEKLCPRILTVKQFFLVPKLKVGEVCYSSLQERLDLVKEWKKKYVRDRLEKLAVLVDTKKHPLVIITGDQQIQRDLWNDCLDSLGISLIYQLQSNDILQKCIQAYDGRVIHSLNDSINELSLEDLGMAKVEKNGPAITIHSKNVFTILISNPYPKILSPLVELCQRMLTINNLLKNELISKDSLSIVHGGGYFELQLSRYCHQSTNPTMKQLGICLESLAQYQAKKAKLWSEELWSQWTSNQHQFNYLHDPIHSFSIKKAMIQKALECFQMIRNISGIVYESNSPQNQQKPEIPVNPKIGQYRRYQPQDQPKHRDIFNDKAKRYHENWERFQSEKQP